MGALDPRAVIAGHKRAGRADDPRIFEETRQYIRDFDRIAENTATARELYDQVLAIYPDHVKTWAGLDQHQVRTWSSWHRWSVLAMLAHAFIAVTTAAERGSEGEPAPTLLPLTCNELRHLFVHAMRQALHDIEQLLRWSRWRRRHQARARHCHYQRQAAPP